MGNLLRSTTGHSRHLRSLLAAARADRGLTQEEVAEEVTRRIGDGRSWSSKSVSEWERFQRHPPIDVMAAWARSVGMRLIVDLDEDGGRRVPVLLLPETAEIARALDVASPADRAMVAGILERLKLL